MRRPTRYKSKNRESKPLVTILQPYITIYRAPLFEALKNDLAQAGLEMIVAHGQPWDEFVSRHDSVERPWGRHMRVIRLRLAGFRAQLRWSGRWARRSVVVVAELSSTNLDLYLLALGRRSTPFILWGHGLPAVGEGHPLDERLELWLARRSSQVLTYTEGGKRNLERLGLPASKITVVPNSSDTRELCSVSENLTDEDVQMFRNRWDLASCNIACFIGALDPSKRLDLLVEAARTVRQSIPDFVLIIAGDGVLRDEVSQKAIKSPELRLLPYADQRLMALVGRVSMLMLMPGRVGLVATDALTLGLPVVTTDWPYHAPEREYLTDAFCDTVPQDPVAFAEQVVRRLKDPSWLASASESARRASKDLSIEQMSRKMTRAVVDVVATTSSEGQP